MKKNAAHLIVFTALLSPWSLGQAATSTNCSAIENARERLACFDQQYPQTSGDGSPTLPKITSEPVKAPSNLGNLPADPEFSSVQSRRQKAYPKPVERGGALFNWGSKIELDTSIVALRRGDQQRMVFRLANGQVWMQTNPRDLPFKQGDSISIKSGKMGGYTLANDNGTVTRVRRLE